MPVRGRNAVEFEPIMGYFNNLLPLQVDMGPQETFIELVKRVKATVVESFTYPDVPLEELGRELSSLGAEQSSLLYQALFSFQDARQRIKKWGGLDHQMVPIFQRGATEDLGVWFVEGNANMQGGITYNTDIFAANTAHKLHMRLRAILNSVAADPLTKISALVESMEPEFRQRLQQSESKAVSTSKPELSPAGTVPATETEKQLASIWCAELKLKRVSLEDNFFDLGGHSLLAMQVMSAMETQTGKRVNPQRFIFETLGQIAKAYDDAQVQAVEQPGAVKRLFSKLLGKKS
jgi:acyl carrier protein